MPSIFIINMNILNHNNKYICIISTFVIILEHVYQYQLILKLKKRGYKEFEDCIIYSYV